MPKFDGTGPAGDGPGTGRGAGPCGTGLGWFRKRGRRFGWGNPNTKEEEIETLEGRIKTAEERLAELKAEK